MEVITHDQSPDIAGAVDQESQTGAGDQGILYGYACSETEELLPLPVVLAHRADPAADLRPHGWAHPGPGAGRQGPGVCGVCVRPAQPDRQRGGLLPARCWQGCGGAAREIREQVIQPALRELPPDEETEILINPSGRFVQGGFEADTGLTGRKLMVDTYGGLAPHGGGALSGKDGSKVDRSGAYMARYIAKNIVAAGLADACTAALAYAIGKAEPVAVDIDTHGSGEYGDDVLEQAVRQVFDLTPARDDPHPGPGQAHLRPVLQLRPLYPPGRPLGAVRPGRPAVECVQGQGSGCIQPVRYIASFSFGKDSLATIKEKKE